MILLTEKQKNVIKVLNDEKVKTEQTWTALDRKLSEVLDLIFDSKGVDITRVDQITLSADGNSILYTLKPEQKVEEDIPVIPAETV